ncbi:ABC transporter permease [Azospirillum sp. TSH100]|uniref:ABC transporter permease n=1 Tax=Azospirillum sp. TSH100 TaxID=652764 RepID=UPI000D6067ED|nr:ABC transporter permease [Azospirillum sp. TSH100]PWC84489.1 ABC transporter permease [Azospirillum sp. TSH100]QCG87598.1 ABC transporter permease [Azospirillum sp. TSH100]
MQDFSQALAVAFSMILSMDDGLMRIIGLSLRVSLSAVAIATLIGLPLGAAVAALSFPGRRAVAIALNTMMGLPPVVVGLVVYLLLSRSGPFGVLGLLFTPTAMIVAQTVMIVPIVASLARQTVEDLLVDYDDLLRVTGAGPVRRLATLLAEARWSLVTTVLAGFGRASAEVGAVMIVGGNIEHVTRVMTTAIALETSKGDLPMALGLGMVLMTLSLTVNLAASLLTETAAKA